jgi:hypothetical protein
MFGCCAFLPLCALMIIMPMFSAARGWRSLVGTLLVELVVIVFVFAVSFSGIIDAAEHWRTDGLDLLPFFVLLVFPFTIGGVLLYVKRKEGADESRSTCRKCGYDLRATPDRCPECGTLVRHDPERF